MSSLNTLGFNVRRKRNHNTHSPLASKQDKTSSPILAFTAPAPSSSSHISKPHGSSPINKLSTKSKVSKQHLPKDPKQSTLLPFFGTPQSLNNTSPPPPLHSTSRSSNTYATIIQSPSPPLQITAAKSLTTSQEYQNDNEETELCSIRRPLAANELLPMLLDAFGEYSGGNLLDRIQRPILLQVKPNRMLHTETMEDDLSSTQQQHQGQWRRRRRSSSHDMIEDDDDEDMATATLRTAFTKSLSLVPVKKRLCGKLSTKSPRVGAAEQYDGSTLLIGIGNDKQQHLHTLGDEFNNQEQEENEILHVRRSLSPGQVNSLLLDIANEFLAFDNNTWCATYIGL